MGGVRQEGVHPRTAAFAIPEASSRETSPLDARRAGSGVASTNKSLKRSARGAELSNRTCTTAARVFADRNIKRLDWLSLDVEGHELAVLQGVDFQAVTVDVVSLEANDKRARAYLEGLGFSLLHRHRVARMHVDEFYGRPGFRLLEPPGAPERCPHNGCPLN